MSFVGFPKNRYFEGMKSFCLLGDERLAKSAFLEAYLLSAFRFLPFGEEEKVALFTERERHLAAACRYVIDGVREANPIWLRAAVAGQTHESPPAHDASMP